MALFVKPPEIPWRTVVSGVTLLGFRAMLGGLISCYITAAIVGILTDA
jgi:nucleoside permease NupC